MYDVSSYRNWLEQQKGRKSQVEKEIQTVKQHIKENKQSLQRHEEAREIIRTVGLRTQQQLQYHISEITTLALEAVYDDPYQLIAEFVQRRNKTECDLYFERDGMKVDPLSASGGGAVNVAAFALRVASWSMQQPKSQNTLILDEPFANLSVDLLPRACEMLQQISAKLGLQMIIITHAEELEYAADKVFHVSIHNGVTKIK